MSDSDEYERSAPGLLDGEEESSLASGSKSESTGTGGTTTNGGGMSSEGVDDIRDKIAKEEAKAVRRARIIVFVVVLMCAIAISVAMYFIVAQGEEDNFLIAVRIPDLAAMALPRNDRRKLKLTYLLPLPLSLSNSTTDTSRISSS